MLHKSKRNITPNVINTQISKDPLSKKGQWLLSIPIQHYTIVSEK